MRRRTSSIRGIAMREEGRYFILPTIHMLLIGEYIISSTCEEVSLLGSLFQGQLTKDYDVTKEEYT